VITDDTTPVSTDRIACIDIESNIKLPTILICCTKIYARESSQEGILIRPLCCYFAEN